MFWSQCWSQPPRSLKIKTLNHRVYAKLVSYAQLDYHIKLSILGPAGAEVLVISSFLLSEHIQTSYILKTLVSVMIITALGDLDKYFWLWILFQGLFPIWDTIPDFGRYKYNISNAFIAELTEECLSLLLNLSPSKHSSDFPGDADGQHVAPGPQVAGANLQMAARRYWITVSLDRKNNTGHERLRAPWTTVRQRSHSQQTWLARGKAAIIIAVLTMVERTRRSFYKILWSYN